MSTVRPSGVRSTTKTAERPRLAFLGVGWIGQHRLRAIAEANVAEIICVGDRQADVAMRAAGECGEPAIAESLEEVLDSEPDGLLIATPNVFHAEQAMAALNRGIAVFCQKPLSRTRDETQQVIDAAREADRLLAVDFSYRHMRPAQRVRELINDGELGTIFAIDLVFHNAYGPDKAWFYDPALSGGGCLIDLGVHLVDLALWWLNWPAVKETFTSLYRQGQPIADTNVAEDFATASLRTLCGATIRITCSWNASVGSDAVIEATAHGSNGAATIRNVGGSFFDFTAHRFRNRSAEVIHEPPDAWFGRAAVEWARRLGHLERYDADIESAIAVADVLDRLYGRAR